MHFIRKLNFYKKNWYNIVLPNNKYFLWLFTEEEIELDDFQLKDLFINKIFNQKYYNQWYKNIKEQLKFIKNIIQQGFKILWNDFIIFPNYEIRLTAYWPWASYFIHKDKWLIVLYCTETWLFKQNAKNDIYQESKDPTETIVRMIIFLWIEDNLVQKYNLTHNEKKALIDTIFNFVFLPILKQYNKNFECNNSQQSDLQLIEQFKNNKTLNFSQIIKKYIIDKRKPEIEVYHTLEECWFSNKEAKIYYHCLKLNSAPASTIANRCNEKRLTVYHILQDLCKKWIAHENIINKVKRYSVMSIKKLIEYLEFQNKIVIKKLESILPNFTQQYKTLKYKQTIETITWNNSLFSIFSEIKQFETKTLQWFWTNSIFNKNLIKIIEKETLTLFNEQNIKCSFICPMEEKQDILNFFQNRKKNLTLKFVSNFPIQTVILLYWENTIAIIDKNQATISNNTAQFKSRQSIFSKLSK